MTTLTRFVRGAAAALFASALIAAPAVAQDKKDAKKAEVLEKYDASTVVATVGERKITLGDLIRARAALPPQMKALPPEVLFQGLLEQLTRQVAFAEAGAAAGLAKSPKVVAQLEASRKEILAQAYLEQALRKIYSEGVKSGKIGEQVKARHILVKTEDEAKKIKAEIDGGADFAETAKKKSIGPSKTKGGDLGFFNREQMVPAFAEAAFKLKKGEVSGPVKSSFGWHVIKVEDRRAGDPPSFELWVSRQGQARIGKVIGAEYEVVKSKIAITKADKLPPAKAIGEEKLLAK
ncbi:MAG: peptidyl-prolyl cis-trans isomerase [Neomegalonema sp.]|nr:peptidyl-prolyl cis-trans isomerase [Neomegalonema sp.]